MFHQWKTILHSNNHLSQVHLAGAFHGSLLGRVPDPGSLLLLCSEPHSLQHEQELPPL